MILFSILALIIFLLIVFAVGTLVIGGSAFIVVFADVIVCAAILYMILKSISKKKPKKK